MMYKVLLYMICLNLATYLVNYASDLSGLPTENLSPSITPDEFADNFNASRTVDTWSTFNVATFIFGDVVGGLMMMWNSVLILFVGFPNFLAAVGTPAIVVAVLYSLWCFVIFWGVIEWIAGRNASD